MKSRLLNEQGDRTFVLVFDPDDEVMAGLQEFARENELTAGQFTAIGAFRDVLLGWFDLEKNDYEKIAINEQVEVLSLMGNVAAHRDQPQVHAHVVVGKRDGTAHGGHLLEAHVRPTLEVMLIEAPRFLQRQIDEATGLALLEPSQTLPQQQPSPNVDAMKS